MCNSCHACRERDSPRTVARMTVVTYTNSFKLLLFGLGAVPLDLERFYMQNGGSGAPRAFMRAPFRPAFISDFQVEHVAADLLGTQYTIL